MNRDEKDYEGYESHEKGHESHEGHERNYENHEKESERIHEKEHEKESASSPSPLFSRYANSLPLPPSRYTISPSLPSSRYASPPPTHQAIAQSSSRHTIAPSQSRQAIFSSNMNLVHGVVSKYKIRDSYVREEAVSVGMEELWNCTERWKEEKGKFSTYAWRCVDGKVIVKKSIKS